MSSWIPESIIYQVNLRALAAREPRNPIEAVDEQEDTRSPLVYLREGLPQLVKLGFTVLHLMPPFPMGFEARKGIGSPYAAADYYAVDPEHGTLEELRTLVQVVHEAGLHIILGLVPNHTARDHVWRREHPEYYVQDETGAPAFDLDWSDTAKLDYTQAGLRTAMIDMYTFWVEVGFDGFRLDMAHFINDKSFWNELTTTMSKRFPGRELLYLSECYGWEASADLFGRGLNGAYDDAFYKLWERMYGRNNAGESGLLPAEQLSFDWPEREALHFGGPAAAVMRWLTDCENLSGTAPGTAPYLARYTDNHDEGRGIYRFGEGVVRAANVIVFCSAHALPFILTGQEFGAANRPSIHERIQHCDKGYRQTDHDGYPQRDGVEFEGNIFARSAAKRASLYAFYQGLIQLRKQCPELVYGRFEPLDVQEEAPAEQSSVVAFDRILDGQTVRVAVNVGAETRQINAVLFEGVVLWGEPPTEGLLPWQAIVVRR